MVAKSFDLLDAYSVCATGHLEQVITKLRLHRALNRIHIRTENHFVEFLDHHSGFELTQVAALLP